MWHRLLAILPPLAGLVLWSGSVLAQSRTALVIGNSNYETAKALANPANDAKAIAQLLNNAGFEVVMAFDLNRDLMRQVISEFSAKVAAKGPETATLIYYAGHGLQVDGDNYLVPVDARFEKESDVAEQGVRLADLMATLETAPSKIRIIILDACRNNPFSSLNEVAGKGLAIVDAPSGSIVAYSTAPGAEAFDGTGTHSPYAAAFMRTIKTPNLPIEQFFKKVRVLVNDSTSARQTPWESTSLTSDFVFFANANAEAAAPAPALPKVAVAELQTRSVSDAYEVVVAEDSIEYYEEFVRLYPSDPRCDHIRSALSRRLRMVAWHNATKSNNSTAYQAFLSKHGNSEFANAARKLQERPRLVALPSPVKGGSNVGPIFSKPIGPVIGKPSGPIIGTPSGKPGSPILGKPTGAVIGTPSGQILSKPGSPILGKPTGPVIATPTGPIGKPGSPILGKPAGTVISTPTGPVTGTPTGPVVGKPVSPVINPVTTTSVNPNVTPVTKLPVTKLPVTKDPVVRRTVKKGVAANVLSNQAQTGRPVVRRQINQR